jgi:anti-anti-sigma regulatory factor
VATDGGVFAFDAPFRGSMGGTRLNKAAHNPAAFFVGAGDRAACMKDDVGYGALEMSPWRNLWLWARRPRVMNSCWPARASRHDGSGKSVVPQEFNIVVGLTGDAVAVSVSGDLDGDSAGRLRAVLNGIFEAGHRRVVLDLARSGSVDGVTRDMLTRVLKRARSQGGDVVVLGAPEPLPLPG